VTYREGKPMSDVASNNIDLVRAAYAAFGAGDVDAFSRLYSAEVVHKLPGNSRVSGAHRGLPAVLGMYGQLAELSGGTIRVEPEAFFTDGDQRVVSVHHTTGTRNGRKLDMRESIVITISDGRITSLDGFFDGFDAYEAFWE
jgi:ketosteroid isomerase-like protein